MVICFVSIPRWWIAARWTCANSRTPFVHGGAHFASPGQTWQGIGWGCFSHEVTTAALHPTRVSEVGITVQDVGKPSFVGSSLHHQRPAPWLASLNRAVIIR